jgi:hypothetical protein
VTRRITVFNDEFSGERFRLRWEVREGHPNNRLFDKGSQELAVPLGGRAEVDVPFRTPRFNTHVFVTIDGRKIHLRGLSNGTVYIGVTLEISILLRCAQGNGTHLATFLMSDPNVLDSFSDMMRLLAKPPVRNVPFGASATPPEEEDLESEKTEEILV